MSAHPLGHAARDLAQAVPSAAQAWALLRRIPRLPEAAGPRRGLADGPAALAMPQALTLLVIGESTAAGVGAPTQETALGGRLGQELAARTGRAVFWNVIGENGATIRHIRDHLLPTFEGNSIDVAVIAAGANDVMRGHSTAQWEKQLRAVVDGLRRANAGGETLVVLTGVPPFSQFPALRDPLRAYLARRAERIDRRSALLCRELGVFFIPFSDRGMTLDEDFFAVDRFHPSTTGYALWAEFLADKIMQRLASVAD